MLMIQFLSQHLTIELNHAQFYKKESTQFRNGHVGQLHNFTLQIQNNSHLQQQISYTKTHKIHTVIPNTRTADILGVTFDRHLTFKAHTFRVKREAQNRINLFNVLGTDRASRQIQLQTSIAGKRLQHICYTELIIIHPKHNVFLDPL